MKSVKLLPKTVLFASSLAVVAFVACGSSDDTNDNPTPTPSAEGGAAGTGGSTAGSGGSTAGTGGSTAGAGGSTAGAGGSTAGAGGSTAGSGGSTAGSGGSTAGSGGSGGSGAPPLDCKGANPSGCFMGTPSKPADYLNCCTDAQCTKFDNTKLPLLVNGQLPPLP